MFGEGAFFFPKHLLGTLSTSSYISRYTNAMRNTLRIEVRMETLRSCDCLEMWVRYAGKKSVFGFDGADRFAPCRRTTPGRTAAPCQSHASMTSTNDR